MLIGQKNQQLQFIKIPSPNHQLSVTNRLTVPEMIEWIYKICNTYTEINSYLIAQLLFDYLKPTQPLVKFGYDIVSCWNLRHEYFGFETPYTHGDKLLLQFPRQLILDYQFTVPIHNFRKLCFKLIHSIPSLLQLYFYHPENSSTWIYSITLNLTTLYPCSLSVSRLLNKSERINVLSVCCPIKLLMENVTDFWDFNNTVIDLLSFPDRKDCIFFSREKHHCLDPRNKDHLGRPFKMKQLWDVCQKLYQNNMLL